MLYILHVPYIHEMSTGHCVASFSSPPSIHGACVPALMGTQGTHQSSKSHSGRANVIQCSARCWLSQDRLERLERWKPRLSKSGSIWIYRISMDFLDLSLFDLVASLKITVVFYHHHHHDHHDDHHHDHHDDHHDDHHHHQTACFP